MSWRPAFEGDVPTLGIQVGQWIEAHVVIPDGYRRGEPYILTDEMWRFLIHFYELYPNAARWPAPHGLRYTGAQLRRPQKWGKDPFGAAIILAEALGPTRFDGWDANGQPVGAPYPTPLIVCLGTSEENVGNTWRPLLEMIRRGPLIDLPGLDAGETRVVLPGGGHIEPATTSARARLGAQMTFTTITEALALDTPLPTPSGWTTMGDVQVGDELIGRDGRPTVVIGATGVQHGRACYRVVFSDGTSIVASDGHLWLTKVRGSSALPKVRTTRDMVDDGRLFRVPVAEPLDGPDVDLPMPAWTLGLWIGDGDAQTAAVTVGVDDLDETLKLLGDDGVTVSVRGEGAGRNARSVRINHGQWWGRQGTTLAALRQLNLIGNKHIPPVILRASRAQRLAFLQGLMDSDGCATQNGHCQFATNKRHIAEAVVELLRSLGQTPRLNRQADPRSRTGEQFKVWFVPRGIVPFRLTRKADRCTPNALKATRSDWVTITSIEPVPSVPVRCVSVAAPDKLFLAGEGWHVTHNSHLFTLQGGFRKVAGAVKRNVAGMDGRWLELTNAYDPSEGSEAQVTAENPDPRVYVDTVESRRVDDLTDDEAVYQELLRQYGDSARERGGWVNIRGRIMDEVRSPRHMEADRRRFFLNEIVVGQSVFVDPTRWDAQAREGETLRPGDQITIGFDGSKYRDATALIACRFNDGCLFTLKVWERPEDALDTWRVPSVEVDQAVKAAFEAYDVGYMYCDPYRWQDYIDAWSALWPKQVVEFPTNVEQRMDAAIERFQTAFNSGQITHDGSEVLSRHAKNALLIKGSKKKQRPGEETMLETTYMKMAKRSEAHKIDAAVAAVLAYAARGQALEDDVFKSKVVTGRLFGMSDEDKKAYELERRRLKRGAP